MRERDNERRGGQLAWVLISGIELVILRAILPAPPTALVAVVYELVAFTLGTHKNALTHTLTNTSGQTIGTIFQDLIC